MSDADQQQEGVKGMVAGFLFNQWTNTVLLIEKQKPDWQAGRLNAVGGKIESGESARAAMKREFYEETGIDAYAWRPFCFLHHTEYAWSVQFFMMFGMPEDAVQRERECPVVVEVNNLPDNVIPNLRWLIPMALDEGRVVADVSDPAG